MPVEGRTHIPLVDYTRCSRKCKLCRLLCPDLAITRNGQGKIEIDYDYCKGCGICAAICPKEAIKMAVEE